MTRRLSYGLSFGVSRILTGGWGLMSLGWWEGGGEL